MSGTGHLLLAIDIQICKGTCIVWGSLRAPSGHDEGLKGTSGKEGLVLPGNLQRTPLMQVDVVMIMVETCPTTCLHYTVVG